MDLAMMGRLGLRQLSSILPEALYLSTGIDLTRPTEIRASVTVRCNYKCLQCGCWRFEPSPEMSIAQWEMVLASIKEFCGPYTIQFVGGEPFVKKGFLDLLEFCREQSIDFGVITNGSAFASDRVVGRFVAARPLKVDISVDGPTPEIHDRLRGIPGSLAAIVAGIRKLRDTRSALGVSFPIRIKPTLNSVNFRAMPDLVAWAVEEGATSIDIEPIREWTDESKRELWLSPQEIADLQLVVSELLRMKAGGAPIETSEHKLRHLPDHFRRLNVTPEVATCRIGMRVFSIDPSGIVSCCGEFMPLGDLTRQSAREVWTGQVAQEVRRGTVNCGKGCPYGCNSTKPIFHTIKRGLMVFGSRANSETGQ
jgi:MoaA/NifB/PqqE/SkfB family radical SAM enzyme